MAPALRAERGQEHRRPAARPCPCGGSAAREERRLPRWELVPPGHGKEIPRAHAGDEGLRLLVRRRLRALALDRLHHLVLDLGERRHPRREPLGDARDDEAGRTVWIGVDTRPPRDRTWRPRAAGRGPSLRARRRAPTVTSLASSPSFLASAAKSLAAARTARASSALASAARSLRSAASFSLILRDDSLKGCTPPSCTSSDLDGVVAERRAHRLGRDLALLQREHGLLERRHHLALAHEAEIAAPGRGGGVLGELAGRACRSPRRPWPRRIASSTLALDLFSASLPPVGGTRTRMWEALRRCGRSNSAPVLLVVRLGVRVGHREGEGTWA